MGALFIILIAVYLLIPIAFYWGITKIADLNSELNDSIKKANKNKKANKD